MGVASRCLVGAGPRSKRSRTAKSVNLGPDPNPIMKSNLPETADVLLVYPPGATRRAMEDALSAEGINCVVADGVLRAVTRFSESPADLVVLGLRNLADRDLDVLGVLRERSPGVHVLLAFPSSVRERAVKALASGADCYILEPFYLSEFVELVRRGLERARLRADDRGDAEPERLAVAVAEVINNRLQILELLLTDFAEGATEPEEIRDETYRIKEVAEELLAFARKEEYRPVRVDLNRMIETLLSTQPAMETVAIDRLGEDVPEIEGDPRGLASLVVALSGMAGGGRLEIASGTDEAGRAVLTVWAPDLVLDEKEVAAFFEPFVGPAGGAVGLAAATAKGVIEAHGAVAKIESREATGTAVTVRFPPASDRK